MKKPNKLTQIQPQTICCLTLLLLHTHFSVCKRVSGMAMDSLKRSELEAMRQTSPIEGAEEEPKVSDEMQMDSEMNRRLLLMSKSYLSYETLRRDMTPCERPGSSYYNCRSTGVANPYTRGCEMIVGCARDIRDNNF